MTLGDFIRTYRAEHDMSMQDFSDRCGLSKAYISILERNINPASGKPPIPSLETIQAVARVMGVDFNTIISALDRDQKIALETSDAVPTPTLKQDISSEANKYNTSLTFRAIVASLEQLNEDGQKRVCEYAEDLVASGRYERTPCSKGAPTKAV